LKFPRSRLFGNFDPNVAYNPVFKEFEMAAHLAALTPFGQSHQWMQSTGFASIPACAFWTSASGTQLKIEPAEYRNHVSQGGASSMSKKPRELESDAPSVTDSNGS
jgi:hypothetical protein